MLDRRLVIGARSADGPSVLVRSHATVPHADRIASPSVDRDLIYVSSFYDGSLMVRMLPDKLAIEKVWRIVGSDEKKTESLHAMIGTPIVSDGYVYGVDSYGQFRCLDAKTGQRIWESQDAVPKARWAAIHMVRQQDRVWMFNERGELLITKLSPKACRSSIARK